MRNLDKKVFNRLEEVCVSYKFLNDDVCYFYGVSWKDYYNNFEDCSDIVSIDYDSKYMNRKGYNIIMISDKKLYGNKNMDNLFRNELFNILDSEGFDEMLVSDIENNYFDNKSLFGLLYNFRSSRWSVNSYSDRFEMWCRRSGLLKKRDISKESSYKRRWIVKLNRYRGSKDMSLI